eukprot:m.383362 g.383362  ORF g.383362 m.383362 type:complete len:50 (-) comp125499_c0_seq1:63-212(-)
MATSKLNGKSTAKYNQKRTLSATAIFHACTIAFLDRVVLAYSNSQFDGF